MYCASHVRKCCLPKHRSWVIDTRYLRFELIFMFFMLSLTDICCFHVWINKKYKKRYTICSTFFIENPVYTKKPRYGGILKVLTHNTKILYFNYSKCICTQKNINWWHNLHIFYLQVCLDFCGRKRENLCRI